MIPIVDRAYVYDNSIDGETPVLLFRTVDGILQRTYHTDCAWAQKIVARLAAPTGSV